MTNKGLLVGINNYPGCPLQGCINDVVDMASYLTQKCNFQYSNIRMLTDERATTEGIRDRLNWLVLGAKPGDRLFFHYSGHGSQLSLRDQLGNVKTLHDCICPVNFDFTPEHAICDTDFWNLFKGIPNGVEFNWLSDSCHSGDLSRNLRSSRSYPTPVDISWRNQTAKKIGLKAFGLQASVAHLNGAFISGCRSDQTSADAVFNDRPNGAFTYYFLQQLNQEPKAALIKVVPDVVKALANDNYEQEPQLRGSLDILNHGFLVL